MKTRQKHNPKIINALLPYIPVKDVAAIINDYAQLDNFDFDDWTNNRGTFFKNCLAKDSQDRSLGSVIHGLTCGCPCPSCTGGIALCLLGILSIPLVMLFYYPALLGKALVKASAWDKTIYPREVILDYLRILRRINNDEFNDFINRCLNRYRSLRPEKNDNSLFPTITSQFISHLQYSPSRPEKMEIIKNYLQNAVNASSQMYGVLVRELQLIYQGKMCLLDNIASGEEVIQYHEMIYQKPAFKYLVDDVDDRKLFFNNKLALRSITSEQLNEIILTGPDRGVSRLYYWLSEERGRKILLEDDSFIDLITPAGLNAVGEESGCSAIDWVVGTDEGRELLMNPKFRSKITEMGLNAIVKIGPEKGLSPVLRVANYDKTQTLLLDDPEFYNKINTHGLNAVGEGYNYRGLSAVYALAKTAKGRQIILQNPRLQEMISQETLMTKVEMRGPDQGKSAFDWLGSSDETLGLFMTDNQHLAHCTP